jgi:serine/threonine-protein kinase
MEHVEGETLRAVLSRAGSLPVADAIAIAEQICGAVDAAHRQGVVHRDLKPENIMFKRAEGGAVVKVLDFGLAKVVDTVTSNGAPALTSAGDLFGTPAYMAPEYYEGEQVGSAADVYSIGIVVYEMLAGSPPFQGTVQAIMSGHLFKEPPPLVDPPSEVPPDVDRAIRRALSKAPVDRYATPAEFAACLVSALGGESVDEPKPTSGPLAFDSLAPAVAAAAGESAEVDEVETIGGPKRVSTADLVPAFDTDEPSHEVELVPEEEMAPLETASIPLAPHVVHRRRVMLPAAAAVAAGALLTGLGYIAFSAGAEPDAPPPVPVAVAPVPTPAPAPEPAPPTVEPAPPPEVASEPPSGAEPPASRAEEPNETRAGAEPPARATAKPDDTNRNERRDQAQARADKPEKADAKNANANTKKKKKWYNPKSWF